MRCKNQIRKEQTNKRKKKIFFSYLNIETPLSFISRGKKSVERIEEIYTHFYFIAFSASLLFSLK